MSESIDATYTRLMFYGTTLLNLNEYEVEYLPIGYLLDLIECYKQWNGISNPKREEFIDEVIPSWL